MGDRSSSLLLLPIVALLAIGLPSAVGSARQAAGAGAKPEPRAATPVRPQPASPRTAAGLIREYYEVAAPPPPSGEAPGTLQLRVAGESPDASVGLDLVLRKKPAAPPRPPSIASDRRAKQCLIATLPDPTDAGNLSYMFDRYLDATQRAMEVGGYVLDRFDMPWLDTGESDRYRREPGRLLFRGKPLDDGTSPIALLFVVGETPTGGIHKIAFNTALEELHCNCAATRSSPLDGLVPPPVGDQKVVRRVSVLGPSFSGSQASLRTIISHHKDRFEFSIVSGSATAIDGTTLLGGSKGSVYRATITPDHLAKERFYEIVRDSEKARANSWLRRRVLGRTPVPTRVALLFEGNTSFGQRLANTLPGQRGPSTTAPPTAAGVSPAPAGSAAAPNCDGPSSPSAASTAPRDIRCDIDVVEIPFPLHISRLRAAAREDDPADGEPLDFLGSRRALTKLELRDSAAQRTVVPLQSKLETSSMELVLSSLLETLDEQDLRYIGVIATDVQDLIFLSQQIRHHLPNTLLFMFSNDLLYLHPDVNMDLRGAQIISPYPLFPPNVQWTSDLRRQLLFPSQTTQGVYNATLALLGEGASMQEYAHPRQRASPPPLWLSMVGAQQIWPLRFFDAPAAGSLVPSASGSGTWQLWTPGHPWLALFAIAIGWVPAIFMISNAVPGTGTGRVRARLSKGLLAELFSESIFPGQRRQRRIYLLRCWSSIATPYLFCASVLVLPWAVSGLNPAVTWIRSPATRLFELSLTLGLILVGYALFSLTRLACGNPEDTGVPLRCAPKSPSRFSDARRSWPAVLWVLVPIACALVVAWVWVADRGNTAEDAVFLYLRSTELDSGVSPLLPLLVLSAAALIWSVTSLRRLRLLEGPSQYPVRMPTRRAPTYLGFVGGSFKGVSRLEQALVESLGQRAGKLAPTSLGIVIAIMVVSVLGLFLRRGVPSAEGAAFDLLFAVSFFVVNLAAALTLVRLLLVWSRLSRLLRRLAWHPMIKTYDRLGKATPGKPKINITRQSQIFTALEFSVDRAAEMVAKARELTEPEANAAPAQPVTATQARFTNAVEDRLATLTVDVAYAQRALHRALKAAANGRWADKVACRTVAEQHLSCIAAQVTSLVRPAWRLPAEYWIRTDKDKPDEAAMLEAAEDFLASRVGGLLSHVVPQLQNLVVCMMSILLLVLTAVTVYPFQPRQLLLMFTTVEIIVAAGATLLVFVQMERDTILSALSDSAPGQISWGRDFILRLVVYIVLPLLGVIGAQFPEAVRKMFVWSGSAFGTH